MAANRRQVTSLTIGHWNANGIRGNYREFTQFLRDHNIDIMLINETRLTPKCNFNVAGYNVIRKDRDNNKAQGGVLILIKTVINYSKVSLKTVSIESVAIRLVNNTIFASVYNPPRTKIYARDLETIFGLGNKVLIYGDLNAKSTAWNCKIGNPNGKIVYSFALKNTVKILAPDNYTLYPYSNTLPSIVDIGLIKNINCHIEINTHDELNSDHIPVVISVNNITNYAYAETEFFDYMRADWNKFRNIISDKLVLNLAPKNTCDIDSSVEKLTSIILNAAQASIPKRKFEIFHKKIGRAHV